MFSKGYLAFKAMLMGVDFILVSLLHPNSLKQLRRIKRLRDWSVKSHCKAWPWVSSVWKLHKIIIYNSVVTLFSSGVWNSLKSKLFNLLVSSSLKVYWGWVSSSLENWPSLVIEHLSNNFPLNHWWEIPKESHSRLGALMYWICSMLTILFLPGLRRGIYRSRVPWDEWNLCWWCFSWFWSPRFFLRRGGSTELKF